MTVKIVKPSKTTQISIIDTLSVKDNQIMASSTDIAGVFNKEHAKVIRAIEKLDCSKEFTHANFGVSEYKDSSGKINKCYNLTKDAVVMLTMSFTGKQAFKFKEAYITAFNKMQSTLSQQKPKLPLTPKNVELHQYYNDIYIYSADLAELMHCDQQFIDQQIKQIKDIRTLKNSKNNTKNAIICIKKLTQGYAINTETLLLLDLGSDVKTVTTKIELLDAICVQKEKKLGKVDVLLRDSYDSFERGITNILELISCNTDYLLKQINNSQPKVNPQVHMIIKMMTQVAESMYRKTQVKHEKEMMKSIKDLIESLKIERDDYTQLKLVLRILLMILVICKIM